MSEQEKPKVEPESTEAPSPEKKGGMGLYLIVGLGTLVIAGAVAFALGGSNSGSADHASVDDVAAVSENVETGVEAASQSESADEVDDLSFLNTDELEKAAREAADELARQLSDDGEDAKNSSGSEATKRSAGGPAGSHQSEAPMSKKDSLAAVDWLTSEKSRLATWEKELNGKQKKLDAQAREVDKKLKQADQLEASRLTSLAKLYDGMKHDQVARMIVKLDDKTIVSILPRMKTANASKILGLLPPDRGARISRKMITLSSK